MILMQHATNDSERRVLLLAPTLRDGEITRSLLASEGLPCLACRDVREVASEVAAGAGALLLTDEALMADGIEVLLAALDNQPSWSDLPVVILMPGGGHSPVIARVMRALGNVTLMERPVPMRSLLSAVQAAIRGRQRQYEARSLLQSERAARAEAEKADRMKDEFLATLSHELRTPLNAILGWAQVIRHSRDNETLDEGLAIIERNARVQVQLIEDLLDMSRIISGKIRLDTQMVDPATFIDAAIKTVMPAAEAKGIHLEKLLAENAGAVTGDPNRLQQVVWNLLANAIKFTPKGGRVTVLVERVGSQIEISVSDTGQGISPQFLPHVFERFRQADGATTRSHGGLGLGLAIVKHLVELHGGTIGATSAGEGQGSTFTVSLPVTAIRRPAQEKWSRHQRTDESPLLCEPALLNGLTVLVVDDDQDARELLHRILEECGARVISASSATEGVSFLERAAPSVLISDIGMPEVDGYEFLRRARALWARRGQNVPAIALTAFARSEDRTRALLAGYMVHVSKPVDPQELLATVASLTGRTGAESAEPPRHG